LKKWAEMTDGNYHGEVREEIARWYQKTKEFKDSPCQASRDYLGCFKYVNKAHEGIGSMTMELLIIRNILTNAMLGEIEKINPKVADNIHACL